MKHLILDMRANLPPVVLNDTGYLEVMLRRLVKLVDMVQLDEPNMYKVSDGENSGVTGFQIITTSHISIHTWPENHIACFDLFSCKDFDTNAVIKFVGGYLRPYYIKITEVPRIEL